MEGYQMKTKRYRQNDLLSYGGINHKHLMRLSADDRIRQIQRYFRSGNSVDIFDTRRALAVFWEGSGGGGKPTPKNKALLIRVFDKLPNKWQ